MALLGRIVSTLFMFTMNILANALPLNGMNTGELSDLLPTLITPAGFTFSIWGIIYLGLLGLTIALIAKKVRLPDKAMMWYIVSALANGLRIFARHFQNLHFSLILMLVILASLIMLLRSLKHHKSSIAYYERVRGSIFLYLGRIQIATLLMITLYLQYQLTAITGYEVRAAIVALILAGCANLFIICREKNIITSIVALRALYGIMSSQSDPQIILTTQIVMGLLLAGIVWLEGRKYLKR